MIRNHLPPGTGIRWNSASLLGVNGRQIGHRYNITLHKKLSRTWMEQWTGILLGLLLAFPQSSEALLRAKRQGINLSVAADSIASFWL